MPAPLEGAKRSAMGRLVVKPRKISPSEAPGGAYHSVSKKWLQGYLNEYAWRYNHRDDAEAQFKSLLLRATVS